MASLGQKLEIEVGIILRPHGLAGAVKVRLYDPSSLALHQGRRITLALPEKEHRIIESSRPASSALQILKLEGTDDRAEAERICGARIIIAREEMEPLAEGQHYYTDLIGCLVLDEAERSLGEVHHVFSAGASDVIVVRQGKEERMIPLCEEWVSAIDMETRTIRILGGDQWEPYPIK
jgi:16S rRNA processing protein RimM